MASGLLIQVFRTIGNWVAEAGECRDASGIWATNEGGMDVCSDSFGLFAGNDLFGGSTESMATWFCTSIV